MHDHCCFQSAFFIDMHFYMNVIIPAERRPDGTVHFLLIAMLNIHQSSGRSPAGAIFTSFGSKRATISMRSFWAAITFLMSL